DKDTYNFNKSRFMISVISTGAVVTGSERRRRLNTVQQGDQDVCAARSCTLPFIIYKGRVHISAWYKEADIPRNWKLSVSKSGWTNNALGLE
ncbi:uncharacterized protein M421DRAFT_35832, partial [Didymella exigua CBS 183.55]